MNFLGRFLKGVMLATAASMVIAAGLLISEGMMSGVNVQFFGPAMVQHNGNLPPFKYKENSVARNENKHNPIIRLHFDGQFVCSAFVVSDTYAVTAAHCIVDGQFFIRRDEIQIYDIDGNDTKTRAKPAAVNTRVDYGLVQGDFKKFNKTPLGNQLTGFLYREGPFASFGFPWGGELMVTPLRVMPNVSRMFNIHVLGPIYPGMSGGPVLDMSTGQAVGINHAVDQAAGSLITPIVNLFDAMDIKTVK